jgi:hypothetical protein
MNPSPQLLPAETGPPHAEEVRRALVEAGLDFTDQQLRALTVSLRHGQEDEQIHLARQMQEIAVERRTAELECQVRERTAELRAATRLLRRAQTG